MSAIVEILAEPLRSRCRNPRCRCALPEPTEPRRAFCARGCYTGFYRTRCRVCDEPSRNGRLCSNKCRNANRQNPGLYGFKSITKASDGPMSPKRISDERNPYKLGLKTRARTWGPTLTDDEYWLATLPLDPETRARVNRANSWDRIRLETAWGRPKVLFGPDTAPLNVTGGNLFPHVPEAVGTGPDIFFMGDRQ
jgi:hypothetical protein